MQIIPYKNNRHSELFKIKTRVLVRHRWETVPISSPEHSVCRCFSTTSLMYKGEIPYAKTCYATSFSSSCNCGLYGPHMETVRPATGNRRARNWKTRFYIRLSYIIHAVKRQNQ